MASPKSKVTKEIAVAVPDLFKSHESASEKISSTHTQELVIALCGPIGSPLHSVSTTLKSMLEDSFGYSTCPILTLSAFIGQHAQDVGVHIPEGRGFARINAQIDAGNKLRNKYGASILAELAINNIRVGREALPDSRKENGKLRRISPKASVPRLEKSLEALPTLEALVVESLARKKLIAVNLEGSGEAPSSTAA